jgi:hypothetical protein
VAKTKKNSIHSQHPGGSDKGIVLVAAMVFTVVLLILGFSVLMVANNEIALTRKDINKTKAFYLAEAGIGVFTANSSSGNFASISETSFGEGTYTVDFNSTADPPYAVSAGTVRGCVKRIKVKVGFLAPPFEYSIYAGGFGGGNWTLMLNGEGNPIYTYSRRFENGHWVNVPISDYSGKDTINGNIYVDGDVWMREESCVNPPNPNTYGLAGDVDATGDITQDDSSTIAGEPNDHIPPRESPDLIGMNYAVNNTHNVSQIFADITSGYLPVGSALRDIFVKNPTDRSTECSSTSGDDFFFEPSSGFVVGGPYTGDTPLHAGTNRVYYVDGDVWVHSKPTYGFKMDGKATIVATGNIHVCDNLQYADPNVDMLGLVALGTYEDGELVSGGNIYFGDPGYGNMSVFSGMMFAANDFKFNTDPVGSTLKQPESGFTINGNLTAMNQVSIERDWYTISRCTRYDRRGNCTAYEEIPRPARYDTEDDKWYDSNTGAELTLSQINTIKHYQMVINYDDRVRSKSTQPPGLPRGAGFIFEGLIDWEELP